MRHGQRHLSYAVSTVLGLAAPAVAALLLTASTPGLAAVPPVPAEQEARPHVPTYVVAPVVHQVAAKPVLRPVARPARPVRHVVRHATPVRRHVAATHHTAVRPAVRHTTTRTTTTRTTTTTTTRSTTSTSTAQPRGTDDYPYRTQTDYYAIDRWGFTERQCVSFAAWRLAQHGHTISNDAGWGSAYHWDETARSLGRTVTTHPRVGAIAQWNADESSPYYSPGSARANGSFTAGGYGHVGWVKQVYSDGSALVEQYNMGGNRSYSVMRVKAPRYLLV